MEVDMKKKVLALALALSMVFVLTACGGGGDSGSAGGGDAEYNWKMALNGQEGDNAYDYGVFFKDKIEELTEGKVAVELYGGAQLGDTTEVLEGMSEGVADIMVESVGTLAPFSDLANIEAMPYMINSKEHFDAVWEGEVGDELKEEIGKDAGFKLLGASYRGPRIVTATKEMKTVDDFKGFKLRTPDLDMYVKTWKWMGAAPTPLGMSETYTAIQQKTVDGQENPMASSLSFSLDEVCDYWIKTNHVYGCNVVIMDREYFEGLPEDIQAAVEEAAEWAGEQTSAQQEKLDAESEQQLKDDGKKVIEVDTAAFAKHFEGFAESEFPDFADWVKKIKDADPSK